MTLLNDPLDWQSLLLLTDVAGVLDGEGILIPKLTVEGAVGLTEDGTASGGEEGRGRRWGGWGGEREEI